MTRVEFNGLVNQLAQEVAVVQRELGTARQKLTSTTRSLEIRTQELTEARNSLSLLLATLDASDDGLLAVSHFGRAMHFNSRFAEMWGIPGDKVDCLNDAALLALQLAQVTEPARFLEISQARTSRPDEERCDVVETTDGRLFECHLVPHRVRGRRVGSVTRYRDVTGTRPTRA